MRPGPPSIVAWAGLFRRRSLARVILVAESAKHFARVPGPWPGTYVRVYSGPLPPSGGVSRPPFAVIAPHCTQLDGVTWTRTLPASSAPISYTWAGHIRTHSSATSRGTRVSIRRWFGWSSRVLFPEAKTDESLSKVSFPSGTG